jgi:uncharacterized protein YkwD
LRSFLNLRAAVRASSPSLAALLRRHRAITRLALAGLALAVALGVSLQDAAAGIPRPNTHSASILPESIGAGVLTTQPITLTFTQAMDPQTVEAALTVEPAVPYRTSWSGDGKSVQLRPASRWQTDQRYVVSVPGSVTSAAGRPLYSARQVTFTTQTAPVVSAFKVHLVEPAKADAKVAHDDLARNIPFGDQSMALGEAPLIDAPEDTAADASSATGIRIGFSAAMNRADVQSRFRVAPKVRGTFGWSDNELTFTPTERLQPGTRYAVSLVNAHDLQGNRLAGDVAFSFTTRSEAELVRFTPGRHETGVVTREIVIRFSEPMNQPHTRAAFRVRDVDADRGLAGVLSWNDRHTRLVYRIKNPLAAGHTIEVRLGRGARDTDGNRVAVRWRFETKAAPQVASSTVRTPAGPALPSGPNAPAGTLDYALWLINQSRADYGFAPLRLDAAVSEVAAGHAWDQVNYGYFSHTGRDGSRVSDRLRAAGIGFSWSGENMCYYNGMGVRAMLDWCHRTFMSEPYPGVANHIGNILSAHYTRVGVGIAQRGGKVIIVWDFAG